MYNMLLYTCFLSLGPQENTETEIQETEITCQRSIASDGKKYLNLHLTPGTSVL